MDLLSFDSIVGNEAVKRYLKQAISYKNLQNAFIFSGFDGIGKSIFAKIVSSYLMYPEEREDNLYRIEKEIHPDLHIYRPSGKTSMHPISSIREIIDQAYMMPFEAKGKIFIIHDADRMIPTSSNALLKLLEEPPLDTYFFLLTSRLNKILPTITSRCIVIRFSPIDDENMISLIKKWGKTEKEALKIVKLSQGSISKASEISSYVDNDEKMRILMYLLSKKIGYPDLEKALKKLEKLFFEQIDEDRVKQLEYFLLQIYLFYKDMFLMQKGREEELYFEDKLDILRKAKKIPIEEVYSSIEEVKKAFSLNVSILTCLEYLFFRLKIII